MAETFTIPNLCVGWASNILLLGVKGAVSGMLEKVAQVRLLVVGDVMLDRYWFGEVSRISPEAPVPVVKVERIEER